MSRSRHSLRWIIITGSVVASILIIPLLILLSMFIFRDSPGPRSLEDALQAFREGDSSAIESKGVVIARPASGVYRARASGRASISFPPTSQKYGEIAPVTITHVGDNCWTITVDFTEAFQQRWNYCIDDGVLTEHANFTTTRWDLGATSLTNRSTFDCSPPGAIIRPGILRDVISRYTCTGTSDNIEGSTNSDVTFESLGTATLMIDGSTIPTFHYRETDALSGSQRGSTVIDYWYAVSDLLLIRMERRIDIRTESPIGDVTYEESGEWQLDSLAPSR